MIPEIPDPLHPAVVHFPIVLALLLPLGAALVLWAVRTRRLPARAWAVVLALQLAAAGSAWLAEETGERDEEVVERVVAERALEAHEEAAERLVVMLALGIPLAAAGLLRGRWGEGARMATLLLGLASAWAVVGVGHSGGELVYRHGAASAHGDRAAPAPAPDRSREWDDD